MCEVASSTFWNDLFEPTEPPMVFPRTINKGAQESRRRFCLVSSVVWHRIPAAGRGHVLPHHESHPVHAEAVLQRVFWKGVPEPEGARYKRNGSSFEIYTHVHTVTFFLGAVCSILLCILFLCCFEWKTGGKEERKFSQPTKLLDPYLARTAPGIAGKVRFFVKWHNAFWISFGNSALLASKGAQY